MVELVGAVELGWAGSGSAPAGDDRGAGLVNRDYVRAEDAAYAWWRERQAKRIGGQGAAAYVAGNGQHGGGGLCWVAAADGGDLYDRCDGQIDWVE